MKYQLTHHSLTGARATNQDRVVVLEREENLLMVLADGLGGHEGGALAAETLVETARRAYESLRQPLIGRPETFLSLIIEQAHAEIVRRGQRQIPAIKPRTTCVLCLVQRGIATWAHVGDSRLYHFRGGEVLTRTRDHSVTEELVKQGVLNDDEAVLDPRKSQLIKAVGGTKRPGISHGTDTPLQTGDVLMMCSDGVWEALSEKELAKYLAFDNLDEGVEEMLLAVESRMKGRCDNISAVALRWRDLSATLAAPAKNAPGGTTVARTLEETIDELDAFLSKFEKH